MPEIIILVWFCALGACIGSFVNAATLRYSKGESFVKGRSRCPACGTTLRWFELVPLVSFLVLRGRCRGCKAKISWRYPAVEAVCTLTAALCWLRFEVAWMTPLAFAVCAILLAVTLIDGDTMEIPNGLVIALIPFAVGAVWARPEVTLLQRGIGFLTVSLPMFLLALIIKNAFGGGDIKLMAVCGFLLGWQNTLLAFFIAVVLGGGYAVYLIGSKKSKKGAHIAFGPYLCIGVAAAMLYGKEILSAYLGLFGL